MRNALIAAAALALAGPAWAQDSSRCRGDHMPRDSARLLDIVHQEQAIEPQVENWRGPIPDSVGEKIEALMQADISTRRRLVADMISARATGCISNPDTSFEQGQLRMAADAEDTLPYASSGRSRAARRTERPACERRLE